MSERRLITTLFKYKAWANDEILTAMRQFDEQARSAERQATITILNHTYVVDRIFAANLRRLPHEYKATNTTNIPTLEQLTAAIWASDAWYIDYVAGLGQEDFNEDITFTFTDGKPGEMSRIEMLMHLIMHGEYHRGAIGKIMTELSIKPPDAFTVYLHKTEPAARRRLS